MGYRGKVKQQEKARALRAQNRTLADIAQALNREGATKTGTLSAQAFFVAGRLVCR